MAINLKVLSEPLLPDQVEWRAQGQTSDKSKLIVVCYLTSRTVMTRLDDAFGLLGWQSSFNEVTDGFVCTISVRDDNGEWISKSDGAQRTEIEKLKGGISGSLKRCAVHFGIGRSLYDLPKVMLETTDRFIPKWAFPLLDQILVKFNSGAKMPEVIVLKPSHANQ